jgi:hypothetical protein
MSSVSLTNIDTLAYNSQLPTDKIVGVFEDSFEPGSATTVGNSLLNQLKQHSFSHGFNRPVFTKLIVSIDGSVWQDGGATSNGLAYSTASQIRILTDRTTGTLHYKVIAFWIDDYDDTNPQVPTTTGSQSDVWFDSRLNYQKRVMQEVATHDSGVGSHSNTVTHSLGYKPNARVYFESFANQVWPAHFGGAQNKWLIEFNQVECAYAINNNTVVPTTFGGVSSPSRRTWTVVYYDV